MFYYTRWHKATDVKSKIKDEKSKIQVKNAKILPVLVKEDLCTEPSGQSPFLEEQT